MKAETLRKLATLNLDQRQMSGVLEILADLQSAEEARLEAIAVRTRRYRQRGGDQIDPVVRSFIMKRDHATCQECGSTENPQIDHIHPVSKGGSSDADNLQVLCRPCNARKRDRVRKRNSAEFGGISTEELGLPPSSPVPLDPPSQTLPPIIPQTPSSTEPPKRARRLADDWALPAGWGRWALDQGHSEATIRLEADKFADFWRAKGGKDAAKLDWEATWRNWMRNAPKARNLGTPAPKPKSEFMQHQDDVQRELDKALGRKRDDEFTGNTLDLEAGHWRAH